MYVSGPDGSAGSVQDIEVYPGTMVIALGGHEFIGPTIAGDENEAKPISDEKVEVVRTIAKTLTKCRRNCVLLPPPGTKFGVGPTFDDNTIQIARILDECGIIYYRPAMWTQLQMYEQYYPLDTLENRRVYMRLFQCLMRVTEWYGMIWDKYCNNGSTVQTELGQIQRFCPHDCDPAELIVSTTQCTEEETMRLDRLRRKSERMPSPEEIAEAMGTNLEKGKQLYAECADWSAQNISLLDKRDQEQIRTISMHVQEITMRMKLHLADANDYVYVSKRAPSSFKSCMMFDKKHKIARIKEMFNRASEAAEQRKESIREESMKDVPTQSGTVAEMVKTTRLGKQRG